MNRLSFYSRTTTAADYLQARAPRELWAAAMKQAIDDVLDGPSQFETRHLSLEEAKQFRRDIQVAAEEWMADEENEPRRFVWVCEQLGLEPAAVRAETEKRRHSGIY